MDATEVLPCMVRVLGVCCQILSVPYLAKAAGRLLAVESTPLAGSDVTLRN